MPIYQYRCQKCNKITDEFMWVTQFQDTIQCQCGGIATNIISPPGGIKMGDLVMSVIKKGNPNESADENFYRCCQVAEATNTLPAFKQPEEKANLKRIRRLAKENGW